MSGLVRYLRHPVARATGFQVAAMVTGVLAGIVIARIGGPAVKGEAAAFAAINVVVATAVNLDLPQQALIWSRAHNAPQAVLAILTRSWWVYALLAVTTVVIGFFSDDAVAVIAVGTLLYLVGSQLAMGANGLSGPTAAAVSMFIQQVVMLGGGMALGLLGLLTEQSVKYLIMATYLAPLPYVFSQVFRGRSHVQVSLRDVLLAGLAWQPARIFQYVLLRGDMLAVYVLFSPSTTGVYSVGLSTATLVGIAPTQFANMVLHRGAHEVKVSTGTEVNGAVLAATVAAVPLAIAGPWLIPAFYGEPFRDAYVVMLACLPGAIAFGALQVLGNRERMSYGPKLLTVSNALGIGVMAVVIAWTHSPLGMYGVAIASSLSSITAAVCLQIGGLYVRGQQRPNLEH